MTETVYTCKTLNEHILDECTSDRTITMTISRAAFEAAYLNRVDGETFDLHFLRAREESDAIAENTSVFDLDSESESTMYWLTADGRSGFAIRESGELVFVWSQVKGRGDSLVRAAVDRGADHLDCFDGYLPTLYSRHGFIEVKREANWTPGGPDVVYMAQAAQCECCCTDDDGACLHCGE